jgi:hypothetical protein
MVRFAAETLPVSPPPPSVNLNIHVPFGDIPANAGFIDVGGAVVADPWGPAGAVR